MNRSALAALCPAAVASAPAAAQQPADSVYELRSVEVAPRALNGADMAAMLATSYPAALRDAGVSGTVRVSMIVGADGVPREPRVVESADTAFDAPTLAAVGTLRFSPAQRNEAPVNVRVELPVVWQAPAPVDRIYAVTALPNPPRPLNIRDILRATERAYPPHLRQSGIEPSLNVRLVVGRDGVPVSATVLRSTHPEVNEPVTAIFMRMRFTPALVDGQPVRFWADLPVDFHVAR